LKAFKNPFFFEFKIKIFASKKTTGDKGRQAGRLAMIRKRTYLAKFGYSLPRKESRKV
jgi:hypothetical protein